MPSFSSTEADKRSLVNASDANPSRSSRLQPGQAAEMARTTAVERGPDRAARKWQETHADLADALADAGLGAPSPGQLPGSHSRANTQRQPEPEAPARQTCEGIDPELVAGSLLERLRGEYQRALAPQPAFGAPQASGESLLPCNRWRPVSRRRR